MAKKEFRTFDRAWMRSTYPPSYGNARGGNVRRLFKEGLSLNEIAERLGIDDDWMVRYLSLSKMAAWDAWMARHPDYIPPSFLRNNVVPMIRPGKAASEELVGLMKQAYEENPASSIRDLARQLGVAPETMSKHISRDKPLMERVSAQRELLQIGALEAALLRMTQQFQQAVDGGRVNVENMNPRDFAVMYGIMVDKKHILTGGGGTVRKSGAGDKPETLAAKRERLDKTIKHTERVLRIVADTGKGAALP